MKDFEEARNGRLATSINQLFWKSGAVIDIAKNSLGGRFSELFSTRVWCIPGFGTENKSALFQGFLLISAVLRVQGRFQNLPPNPGTHQTPVEMLSEFRPRKKKLAPPPPRKKFPNSPQTPSRPISPLPLLQNPTPSRDFNQKTRSPLLLAPRTPPFPPRAEKNKKYPKTSTKFSRHKGAGCKTLCWAGNEKNIGCNAIPCCRGCSRSQSCQNVRIWRSCT